MTEFFTQLALMAIAATIIASWRSTPAEFALTWVLTFGLGMLTSGTVGSYRDYCRKRRRNRREVKP
jgi:hypothetical protein